MFLFTVMGAIYMATFLPHLNPLTWGSAMPFFTAIMIMLALLVVMHGFMTMSVIQAIPFWNSAILPVLSLASAIWLGTQLGMGAAIAFSEKQLLLAVEPLALCALLAYAFLIVFYFWNAGHSSPVGQESLRSIIKGDLSLLFYVAVVLIGLIIPVAISLKFLFDGIIPSSGLICLRIVCAFIGDLALRYAISKAGRYTPFFYSNVVQAK